MTLDPVPILIKEHALGQCAEPQKNQPVKILRLKYGEEKFQ